MLKKYKANSCVSISVTLPTGGTAHVAFMPQTGNGSVLYTDDEILQSGLEKHPKFGRLFKLEENFKEEISSEETSSQDNVDDRDDDVVRKIEFSCNDDAKDYIADKFGVSRSKLRTSAQIEEAAKEHGIEIVWKK